jgi:hypothetical protein
MGCGGLNRVVLNFNCSNSIITEVLMSLSHFELTQ